jgi:hypothetical protein
MADDLRQLRSATVAGGAAGNLTVAGITVFDKLVTVLDVSAADANLVDEFTVTAADTINNTGGTATTDMILLVQWIERSTRGNLPI